MTLKKYVLRIEGPDSTPAEEGSAEDWRETDMEVLDILTGRCLLDAQDAVNDHLPDGYYCKIEDYEA